MSHDPRESCHLCVHRYLPAGALRMSEIECRRFPMQAVHSHGQDLRAATEGRLEARIEWRFPPARRRCGEFKAVDSLEAKERASETSP